MTRQHTPSIDDLDRCEHGRHRPDLCYACPNGRSTGNLYLTPGQRIGTTVHAEPIHAPFRADETGT